MEGRGGVEPPGPITDDGATIRPGSLPVYLPMDEALCCVAYLPTSTYTVELNRGEDHAMEKVVINKGPFAANTHQHCTNKGSTHFYCRGRIHCQPWYRRWK